MRKLLGAVAVAAAVLGLAGCGGDDDDLTQTEREDRFWSEYEQKAGFAGTDYADPAAAKSTSIELGRAICEQLEAGVDEEVLKSGRSGFSAAQVDVQFEMAKKHLCPDQG